MTQDRTDALTNALDRMSTHAHSVTHELALAAGQLGPAHAAGDATTHTTLVGKIQKIASAFDEVVDGIMQEAFALRLPSEAKPPEDEPKRAETNEPAHDLAGHATGVSRHRPGRSDHDYRQDAVSA